MMHSLTADEAALALGYHAPAHAHTVVPPDRRAGGAAESIFRSRLEGLGGRDGNGIPGRRARDGGSMVSRIRRAPG